MREFKNIRDEFPILKSLINGRNLVYFDSAATTLKPLSVVKRISDHYLYESSNVHRGLHFLSDQATQNFEQARVNVANFLNAESEEVIFTKGTTDSINLVSRSYACLLPPQSTILISDLEHHSNIVPWQQAALRYNLNVEAFSVNEDGSIDFTDFEEKFTKHNVRLLATTLVSNSIGVELPVEDMIKVAHRHGAKVLVDAAQAVAHKKIDVKKLNCDFLAFSAHKLYGPTGVGVLFGKSEILESMPPYEVGGGMIDVVSIKETTFLKPPFRFEAGTPHIAGIIGLSASIEFLKRFSMDEIKSYEQELLTYLTNQLSDLSEVSIRGYSEKKSPIVAFVVEGQNASDVGSLLDNDGIAVRAGHHCTQPYMKKMNVTGTVRASLAMYNTKEEIDFFINSLKKVIKILRA